MYTIVSCVETALPVPTPVPSTLTPTTLTPTTATPTTLTPATQTLSKTVIALLFVGGVVGVLFIIIVALVYLRRKRGTLMQHEHLITRLVMSLIGNCAA